MIDERDSEPRRTVLKALGVATTVAGLGGVVAGQDDNDTEDNETDDNETGEEPDEADDRLPIILGGEASHWFGLSPEAIHEEENPTLELSADEEYELVWINLDGTEHELIIEDSEGEELEASDATETAGEVVSMTFDATEEMAEYYCEYHPEDMRGEIEIDDGFDLSEFGDETDGDNETDEMGADNETDSDNDTDGDNESDELVVDAEMNETDDE